MAAEVTVRNHQWTGDLMNVEWGQLQAKLSLRAQPVQNLAVVPIVQIVGSFGGTENAIDPDRLTEESIVGSTHFSRDALYPD